MKRKKSITSEQEPLQKEIFSQKLVNVLLTHFNYTFDIELSDKTKNLILSNCSTFIKHYIADFFICTFIISLAVVSFWRGVWDHSIVYFEELLKQENSSIVIFLHSKSVVKVIQFLSILSEMSILVCWNIVNFNLSYYFEIG